MRKKIQELRENRTKALNEARAIIEKAETEKRERTADENTRYDKLMDDFTKDGEEVRRLEALLAAEEESSRSQGRHAGGQDDPETDQRGKSTNPRASEEYRAAFNKFLTNGVQSLSADEFRAMQADNDTGGGFLVAPEQFVMQIIKKMDNVTFIRKLATKFSLAKAASLGAPSLDSDPSDSDWTAELKVGNETDVAFGKRELKPHPLSKLVKASNTLIRLGAMPIEDFLMQRLAYIFGITQEKGFLNGSGAGQPLGVFTASKQGISTARDVSTGNKTTSVQFDGLIEAKYSIKGQYWPMLQWIMHRDFVKQVAKLKDGEGQYIWRESASAGEPDRLLGFAVNMSEYAPNDASSGKYAGILGSFEHYWIADALDMQFQRLVELFALTNQTGYIGRLESDGMPVLEEAFARIKLA